MKRGRVGGHEYPRVGNTRAEPVVVVLDEGTAKAPGRSFEEFQALYDKDFIVPTRIREGLERLGPSGWEYEFQFTKIAGVNVQDLKTYRDQFAAHVVVLNKRDGRTAWAGSPETAKKMREKVP
ncbi:MAG: hypothetical protein ACREJC_01985 [Tepidisphaeraceae bacterium]